MCHKKKGDFMPRLDGTGPPGEGSMTGRGLGKCIAANTDENVIYGVGRGEIPYGCGRGRMFGGGRNRFGRRFVQGQNAENDEINILKEQIRKLENKINELEKRETK